MCELLGVSSNLGATVNVSLPAFAKRGGLSGPHDSGWGIAYYEDRDVRLIKAAEPAANSDWIPFLARHSLRSPLVLAHIRRATIGNVAYANTQPFLRELGGRMHAFAHNGNLPGIFRSAELQPGRFRPVGETDSELAFCALLGRLAPLWQPERAVPTLESRLNVVSEFAGMVRALGPANFLYSDGDVLFAHGHRRFHPDSASVAPPGLVTLERWCHRGTQGFVTEGLTVDAADQQIVLVTSVPLTDEAWQPVEEGEVLAIAQGRIQARRSAEHST
ncbi:MAG: class II glutamine amidotransferase [Gammaproteobacteria bacterium]|nr:class II glutamine amidotransferase [Gammaproteobacteria bacterium]